MSTTGNIPARLRVVHNGFQPGRSAQVLRVGAAVAFVAVLLLMLFLRSRYLAVRTAEQDAFNFVRTSSGGYTSEGWTYILFWKRPLLAAGFPHDCLTDNMAGHLVNIRNLDSIILYPPNSKGRGIDYKMKTRLIPKSLSELDASLSKKSLALLERRIPPLKVHAAMPLAEVSHGKSGVPTK